MHIQGLKKSLPFYSNSPLFGMFQAVCDNNPSLWDLDENVLFVLAIFCSVPTVDGVRGKQFRCPGFVAEICTWSPGCSTSFRHMRTEWSVTSPQWIRPPKHLDALWLRPFGQRFELRPIESALLRYGQPVSDKPIEVPWSDGVNVRLEVTVYA